MENKFNGGDLTELTGEETMQLMYRRHLANCLKVYVGSSILIVTHHLKAIARRQYADGLVKWTAK